MRWRAGLVGAIAIFAAAAAPSAAAAAAASPTTKVSALPRCDRETVRFRGEPDYADYASRARRRLCRKPWTLLIYMAADNDLAPYARWDLNEMEAGFRSGREAAGSSARADVIAQLNEPGESSGRRLHLFQAPYDPTTANPKLEDFQRGAYPPIFSPTAGQVPLVDGNGARLPARDDLARFVEWGLREYPADHVMVIVWGHGRGWDGVGYSSSPAPLTAEAAAAAAPIQIPALAAALGDARAGAGWGHRKIDIYASDACLMQTIEVAAEVAPHARFVIGSSNVQNYLGLPYRRLLFEINTGRLSGERARPDVVGTQAARDEGYLVARMLPRIFRMSLEPHGRHGVPMPESIKTATLSSVSSAALDSTLLPALSRLGSALNAYLDEDPWRAISMQDALSGAPRFEGGAQELGGALTQLASAVVDERKHQIRDTGNATLATLSAEGALVEARGALNQSVVAFSLGTLYTGESELDLKRQRAELGEKGLYLLGYRALGAWLPSSLEEFELRAPRLRDSRFSIKVGPAWIGWLAQTVGAITGE
jgi:hypothetical protein